MTQENGDQEKTPEKTEEIANNEASQENGEVKKGLEVNGSNDDDTGARSLNLAATREPKTENTPEDDKPQSEKSLENEKAGEGANGSEKALKTKTESIGKEKLERNECIEDSDMGQRKETDGPLSRKKDGESVGNGQNGEIQTKNSEEPGEGQEEVNTEGVKENTENRDEPTVALGQQKEEAQETNDSDIMDDGAMKDVVEGQCTISTLPPLMKKAVRIFVSSTFTDTKEERNALMEHVYPKVAEFCRDKHGLEFQVVDMRWGVPEHATNNHSTTEMCLNEVLKCQELSAGPSFVVFLGHKYGYRPMPSRIDADEFEVLKNMASTMFQSSWPTVEDWYQLDTNAQPTEYMLSPINEKLSDYDNQEDPEAMKKARNEWWTISTKIVAALRELAMKAHEQQKMTADGKHKYFMSVTENEVMHGILQTKDLSNHSCLCILRTIPDIKEHLTAEKAPRFIDIVSEQVDQEAENFLQELTDEKIIKKLQAENVARFEIEWKASGGNIHQIKNDKNELDEDWVKKHSQYLQDICEQFTTKLTAMIDRGGKSTSRMYTPLNTEVLQHLHFAKMRCQVFEGRDKDITQIKKYLNSSSHLPMTVYGNSGCGKTSIIANVYHKLTQWTVSPTGQRKTIFCVLRFLGTTPSSSNLQDLLESICQQLCMLYDQNWTQPEKISDLIQVFHHLLTQASRSKPILLLFDSIDQLSPTYNAYRMKWLPEKLPNFVKVIISSIHESYPVVDEMKKRYPSSEIIQILPLGETVGQIVISKWLAINHREITAEQMEIVKDALVKCSLPLYARIVCDQIYRWRSFDAPSKLQLEFTIQGAINKHFENMEVKLGRIVVQHSLSYLTSARFGLSEVEMEHVLSLDDQLLNEVFKFWKPPIRRIPPLMWTRVRNEISNYIVERSADDFQVLNWFHRQFIETAQLRYLKDDSEFAVYIHRLLADFFSGVWGGGKLKPFKFTEAQKKRFALDSLESSADRKVPKQKYYTSTGNESRFNKRRVSELPLHLYKSNQLDALKRMTFFHFQWIYARLNFTTSAVGILHELEYFMAMEKSLDQDPEMQILYATMHLIRPYVTRYPKSLPLELTSRLSQYIGVYPLITKLVQQCDKYGPELCPITPIVTSFESASLGLKQNLRIRESEPWHKGGTLVCDSKFQYVYIIDHDDSGQCMLSTWLIESGELVSEQPIGKPKDTEASDVYFQSFLDKKEEHILAMYRKKYYGGFHQTRFAGDGFIDIIRKTDATVVRTIQEYLFKYEFYNSMLYYTENWCAVRFGWKIPLIHLKEENKKVQLSQPHALTADETKFVLTRSKKSGVRTLEGENKTVVEVKTKTAVIRNFLTKDEIGEFAESDGMAGVVFSSIEHRLFLADASGVINDYRTGKYLGEGKYIKPKRRTVLPRNVHIRAVEKLDSDEERQSCRTTLIRSHNDIYLICVYQSLTEWEAFLVDIGPGKLTRYIGRIAEEQPVRNRYPSFSSTSETIVLCSDTCVTLLQSSTGEVLQKYEQREIIRDIFVSSTQPVIVILKGKDVSFLSSSPITKAAKQKGNHKENDEEQLTLIDRETSSNQKTLPSIALNQNTMSVAETVGLLSEIDTEVLNSARSQKKAALDTRITPDQTKIVQLHLRVQIVDSKLEEIKYTPKTSDVILRAKVNEAGVVCNEQIRMPSLTGGFVATRLQEGDRVVAEGNKIKLRVNKDQNLIVTTIPSVLVISENRDGKVRRLHRITTFQEAIQSVTNNYITTLKKIDSSEFVNVYDLESGSLTTTHPVNGNAGCVRLSRNESRLLITNKDLTLRVYSGRLFFTPEAKVQLLESAENTFSVRDIMDCLSDAIVVRYAEGGMQGYMHNHYVHFNIGSNTKSPVTTIRPSLDDVSQDGTLGIDGQLILHDLVTGKVLQEVTYAKRGANMQIQVRIFYDNSGVVFVDKQDDTFHVIRIADGISIPLASGFTHTNLMPALGGLALRASGRVLVLYTQKHQIQAMLLIRGSAVSSPLVYSCASEMDRINALCPLFRTELS